MLNDFVASAVSKGEIRILSDGSPWRPLINVADMARAIEWAVCRPASNGGASLVVHAGSAEWNSWLARLCLPGSLLCPTTLPRDHRARPWLSSEPTASVHWRA